MEIQVYLLLYFVTLQEQRPFIMTESRDSTLNGIRHGVAFLSTANISKWKDDCEDKLSEIWKEVIVTCFKVPSRKFSKIIKENKETR
jgi:hypothetical protein